MRMRDYRTHVEENRVGKLCFIKVVNNFLLPYQVSYCPNFGLGNFVSPYY